MYSNRSIAKNKCLGSHHVFYLKEESTLKKIIPLFWSILWGFSQNDIVHNNAFLFHWKSHIYTYATFFSK